ncbi:LamG-like jellyroll fold domain-containing protein [Pontibacter akesuensis]|uniref:LamG-like jellyroll fold domain-containing protein n=1 Tax=Pontibacter akesuensis TaxID=388950 RepID=UPI00155FEEAE|nr:LamG-like jellyroll fold domain-containing protein [Pontibacter akesuensis]
MATLLLSALLVWQSASVAYGQKPDLSNCPTGIVHYYGFDATDGSPYQDYKSDEVITCTDCPDPASGMFGGALSFAGNDKLTLQNSTNFDLPQNGSFTIEFWVKTTDRPKDNVVMIGRNGEGSKLHWWLGMDKDGYALFQFRDKSGDGFLMGRGMKKINDGQWHHLVGVRDGNSTLTTFYVDGYAIESHEYQYSTSFESSSMVTIGWLPLYNNYLFKGLLDELIVYNRALQKEEVLIRYGNGAGQYCGPQQIAPVIVSDPITFATVGRNYSYDVAATGNPLPTYTLVTAPAGMKINAATGEISWNPGTAGEARVTVKVSNAAGSDEQSYTIKVKQGIGESFSIIHHWMLHEISGSTYKDYYTPSSGLATEATRPLPISGVSSGGQRFDGADDGLNVAQSQNFNWKQDESFSIELWMRTTEGGRNQVLIGRDGKGVDSYLHWWVGLNGSGKAVFELRDINFRGGPVGGEGQALNDGAWHQLVAVRDGGSGLTKLYVDGELLGQTSFSYPYGFSSSMPVNIGYLNREGGYHFNGDLDEVKLFGTALSPEDIAERYQRIRSAMTELLTFEARLQGPQVVLDWETMSEINTKDFVIERSADGQEFTAIGTVAASGTTQNRVSYTFTDADPLKGVSYYRLRINKTDVAYTYSNIVQIENQTLNASKFIVYPNPITEGEVTINVTNLIGGEEVLIRMSEVAGKTLLQEKAVVNPDGTLSFKLLMPQELQPGIYLVSITTGKKSLSRKVLVIR